jgi:hypothetical protein
MKNTLLGAALGAMGQGITYGINKKQLKDQFKMNKRMFDYQNAYNTPKRQMERLKAAGLNPALMYGQGNTGNAQGYAQMGFTPHQFSGLEMAQSAAAGAGIDLTNANRQKTLQEARISKANAVIKELHAQFAGKQEYQDELYQSMLSEFMTKQDEASLKNIALNMKKNGFYNQGFAQVAMLLTGQDPTKTNLNAEVEVLPDIAEKLGIEPGKMKYRNYLLAIGAAITAGKAVLDLIFTPVKAVKNFTTNIGEQFINK